MMSLSTIRDLSREQGERAAAEGLVPFVYFNIDEVDQYKSFPFPNLGDHEPDGWEEVDRHFADASGFGADDEPALSVRQLRDLLKRRIRESEVTLGWAVVEVGQFQLYVGEFVRV